MYRRYRGEQAVPAKDVDARGAVPTLPRPLAPKPVLPYQK
jgi:hypothetical protein